MIDEQDMQQELLIHVADGFVQVAQVENGILADLIIESVADEGSGVRHIYLGCVERVVPHLQAAFIDIGERDTGFLGAREARVLAEDKNNQQEAEIGDYVIAGDMVLVQITRPAAGDKGASLTANITLAGRNLVLAPYSSRISVSRAIDNEPERDRLTQLVKTINSKLDIEGITGAAGWIIRTVAENVSEDILAADMENVAQLWKQILDKADNCNKPTVLHKDLTGIERILRDYVGRHTSAIIIADETLFASAQAYCQENLPTALPLLSQSPPNEDLFERYDIHGEIEKSLSSRITLASGGWIVIEETQAMTTIDVNSASHNAPAPAVNLEAATAIARQIRLRGIGGLIAIDFIDMEKHDDPQAILDALAAGFAGDKVPVRIGDMSDFGVVEMTRKRQALTLRQALKQKATTHDSK